MKSLFKNIMLAFFLVFIGVIMVACDQGNGDDNGNDNGDGDKNPMAEWFTNQADHDLTIRFADGSNGMVASASSYASIVGREVLKNGGNAFDAAVAVAFALGVTEPNASGLGGGGFLVAYDAQNDRRLSFNYREFAPAAATRDAYIGSGLQTGSGPGAFGIPLFLDGMVTVWEELGSQPWADLLEPSIYLAEEGFPVSKTLSDAISGQWAKMMEYTDEDYLLDIYSADGFGALMTGEQLINTDLANVMKMIANAEFTGSIDTVEGRKLNKYREAFYDGDIARVIVDTVTSAGGLPTMADMRSAKRMTDVWEPLSGTYKDYEIISMNPPSSGGVTLVETFNMLEHHDKTNPLAQMDHNSAEYLHVVGSALQLSFADRRNYIADPVFWNNPIEGLQSKQFAADRWDDNFDPEKAQVFSNYGNPFDYQDEVTPTNLKLTETHDEGESGSTTHYTIIDQWGNIVSSTNTINYFFGNGMIAKGTGIHLNNILSPFGTNAGRPSEIMPGKRPISNMSPTIVLKDGEPFAAIGSPGSMRITSAITQTLLNIIEFDMTLQDAIDAPRIHNYVGEDMYVEQALGQDTLNDLRALGYKWAGSYSGINLFFGGVHAIIIDENNNLIGGADPRRAGKALGY